MMDTFNNLLEVTSERGDLIQIKVYDILDENQYNKTFVIYTLAGEDSTIFKLSTISLFISFKSIFASILNETDTDYSLDSITNSDELQYINNEIDMIVNEIEEYS